MNMNIASIAQALCESLTLCRSAGISDETYFEALSRNMAHSGLSELKEPKLRRHNYSAQFSSSIWQKTCAWQWRRHTISRSRSDKPNTSNKPTIKGIAAGWKNDDFIGLGRLLEKQ
jgi:3-hydroxyisobutyrate dehydrogenase-like beta-hydroxyacid dehydrogenase